MPNVHSIRLCLLMLLCSTYSIMAFRYMSTDRNNYRSQYNYCNIIEKQRQRPYNCNKIDSIQYVNEVILQNWGVFNHSSVSFEGTPAFIAITGETGAGKSIFISAIEYVCGLTSKPKLQKGFDNGGQEADYSSVQLKTSMQHIPMDTESATNTFRGKTFQRSYFHNNKKSVCEIDNEKQSMKSIQAELSKTIRFWSTDSIKKLDDNGFIYYVDANVIEGIDGLKEEIEERYLAWRDAFNQLQKYEAMQAKLENGFELDVLAKTLKEIQDLERRVNALFNDVSTALCILSPTSHGVTDGVNDDDDNAGEGSMEEGRHLLQELSQLIHRCTSSTADQTAVFRFNEAYEALLAADVFFRRTNQAFIDASILRTASSSVSLPPSVSRGTPPSPSRRKPSDMHLDPAGVTTYQDQRFERQLREFGDVFLNLQKTLQSLGIDDPMITREAEAAYERVQSCLTDLRRVRDFAREMEGRLPDLSVIFEDIASVKASWDAIAKQQNIKPLEMQSFKQKKLTEFNELSNIEELLPVQRKVEQRLRGQYAMSASRLSVLRYESCLDIARRVNQLLPQLEMADKELHVLMQSRIDLEDPTIRRVLSEGPREGTALSVLCQELFTDSFFDRHGVLQICPDSTDSQGWDVIMIEARNKQDTSSDLSSNLSNPISPSERWLRFTHKVDTSTNQEDRGMDGALSAPLSQTLSSGECARVALALETVCAVRDKSSSNERSLPSEGPTSCRESLLVFDEIDAHVGGDAAIAIAKLLKQQGKCRQIVAVTHNPVIAAAADIHIVVERLDRVRSEGLTDESEPLLQGNLIESDTFVIQTALKVAKPKKADQHSGSPQGSRIIRLKSTNERIREIARMTTGSLDTVAGINLAKALLEINFENI